MKVLCRNIFGPSGENLGNESSWLKVGNEYVVLALNVYEYTGLEIYIQTEHYNEPSFIDVLGFEFINQKIPSSWIAVNSETYGKKAMILLPKSWNYESFFEDVLDEKPEAVKLFTQEAEQIYREEGLL
jgi:hypothetical protein